LTGQLVLLPPELCLLGAEINSIEAMIRKGFLSDSKERLVFLVSDTEDGAAIGSMLTRHFLCAGNAESRGSGHFCSQEASSNSFTANPFGPPTRISWHTSYGMSSL